MHASPPSDAAMSDTSMTRAGSASALNIDARRSAATVFSAPPVSGEQQAARSAVVTEAAMSSMVPYALTIIDALRTMNASKNVDGRSAACRSCPSW